MFEKKIQPPVVVEAPLEAEEDVVSQASSDYKPKPVMKRRAAKAARKQFQEDSQTESDAEEAPKKRGRKK